MEGNWIRRPQGEASAIFVHGVLSSGETCWRHDTGSYWPELLKNEPELRSLGIYVFTYHRIGDIVDALKEHMRLDGVLESKQLIFICHSMGGIVVRKFIEERAAELIRAGKKIDLFLVASPSLGATYADWLSPLAQLFGHAQADALRFVRNNDWLKDLDKEFMNLKEGGTLKIKGKELVEDKFIVLNKFWGRQVVEPFSGARYFGEPYKVPGSDHFSIAKPVDKNAIQHRLLCKFILENVLSPSPETRNGLKPERESAAPSLAAQKPPASGALGLWQEKLAFLLAEEAITVDPDQKFRLLKSIEEAKAKIREHGEHA
jgi:predicted alpha/beta hydrolase family esterase